jgi:serine/threonine protein kinase
MSATKSQEQILLEAALRCESKAEQKAFLDAACANDLDLRRRIEELLAAFGEADAFFRDDPLKQAGLDEAAKERTVTSPPVTEGPGTVIDKYKLLEKLGEGGFGVVYMAEQREPVKRRVALKIIKIGMDTREVVARFEAERQALAMMDHPNIAKVLDAGSTERSLTLSLSPAPSEGEGARKAGEVELKSAASTESQIANRKSPIPGGRPYFVMELVRGTKISDYCDERNLSTHVRLDLFMKVCQAVQHAHQKGIIHRDLKPSNILVTVTRGREGFTRQRMLHVRRCRGPRVRTPARFSCLL